MATVIARNINLDVDPNVLFQPGMFSTPELHFFLENLTKPPIVAFSKPLPAGVIRARAEPTLSRLYELHELQTHSGVPWAGYDSIEDSIIRYLAWQDRSHEIQRRGGPAHPSMFHWDESGLPWKYAIGSDSGEMVVTEITDSGERRPFGVRLMLTPDDMLRQDLSDIAPWIKRGGLSNVEQVKDTIETLTKGKGLAAFSCSICGKAEEYQTSSRQSQMAARARMGKHLKQAKTEINRHRVLASKFQRGGK